MNTASRIAVVLCFTLLAIVGGCGTAGMCCRPAAPASAPELVEIDGREYTLTASLWRDFMPMAPPDGEPLVAVVKVSPADMMPLPTDLAIERVWVLSGERQWSAPAERPTNETPGSRLEASVHNGPKWGPGIKADVVVRLRQGKQTWVLRVAGVDIKRTD